MVDRGAHIQAFTFLSQVQFLLGQHVSPSSSGVSKLASSSGFPPPPACSLSHDET